MIFGKDTQFIRRNMQCAERRSTPSIAQIFAELTQFAATRQVNTATLAISGLSRGDFRTIPPSAIVFARSGVVLENSG
jgi:hypothetical protein